jgi:hypothetical protein
MICKTLLNVIFPAGRMAALAASNDKYYKNLTNNLIYSDSKFISCSLSFEFTISFFYEKSFTRLSLYLAYAKFYRSHLGIKNHQFTPDYVKAFHIFFLSYFSASTYGT